MQYLTKFMAGTLDPLYDNQTYFQQMYNYNVQFNTDL